MLSFTPADLPRVFFSLETSNSWGKVLKTVSLVPSRGLQESRGPSSLAPPRQSQGSPAIFQRVWQKVFTFHLLPFRLILYADSVPESELDAGRGSCTHAVSPMSSKTAAHTWGLLLGAPGSRGEHGCWNEQA